MCSRSSPVWRRKRLPRMPMPLSRLRRKWLNKGSRKNKLCKITKYFWMKFKALIGDSIRCILEPSSNEEFRQKDKSVCKSYFRASPKYETNCSNYFALYNFFLLLHHTSQNFCFYQMQQQRVYRIWTRHSSGHNQLPSRRNDETGRHSRPYPGQRSDRSGFWQSGIPPPGFK